MGGWGWKLEIQLSPNPGFFLSSTQLARHGLRYGCWIAGLGNLQKWSDTALPQAAIT